MHVENLNDAIETMVPEFEAYLLTIDLDSETKNQMDIETLNKTFEEGDQPFIWVFTKIL